MTIRDYIGQKLSRFGKISEADVLDFALKSGMSPDDLVTEGNISDIQKGMIKVIPSLLANPTSVSEEGFSIQWDMEALRNYYLYLCRENGIEPDTSAGISIVSSYNDY